MHLEGICGLKTELNYPFKGTMSHLQAKKMKKVKFQLHLKDNTNLELPLKMSSSGKIMTISCQIDFRAIEPKSNSLDFQTVVPNGHTFYAAQRFSLILAITRSGLLM